MVPGGVKNSQIDAFSAAIVIDITWKTGVGFLFGSGIARDRRSHWFSVVILLFWLMATVLAFWWFQFRNLGNFDDYWASFQGAEFLGLQMENSETPLVVHFVDDSCSCSRFSVPHIAELEEKYAGKARFKSYQDSLPFQVTDAQSVLQVPAGPAVAIWSASGEMAYFGPYSSGAFCGDGEDLVSKVLQSLADGVNPEWLNNEAVGCFCPWSKRGENL